jgi:hypothetical protein
MTIVDLAPKVTIDSGEYYYIENHNESGVLHFQWDKRRYDIAAGKKKLVPFDIIALHFGDPRAVVGQIQKFHDSTGPGQVPERMAEVKRLCVRYGVYEQGMDDIRESVLQENRRLADAQKSTVQRVLPLSTDMFNVRITNIEGVEIITPLFDHKGEKSKYEFELDREKSGDIVTIIDSLQRQIDSLKEKELVLQDNGDNEDEDISADNPGMADIGQGFIPAK